MSAANITSTAQLTSASSPRWLTSTTAGAGLAALLVPLSDTSSATSPVPLQEVSEVVLRVFPVLNRRVTRPASTGSGSD